VSLAQVIPYCYGTIKFQRCSILRRSTLYLLYGKFTFIVRKSKLWTLLTSNEILYYFTRYLK
jgi:hypothetical protein